mgnify:CR=1 FL=1
MIGYCEYCEEENITIFEGYLDAKLYPNSVGMCSANNDFPFLLDNKRYMYDNDVAGKKQALIQLRQGFPVFLWKKYLKKHNITIVYDENNDSYIIKDLTDLLKYKRMSGIKTERLEGYFSNNKMDMIWI